MATVAQPANTSTSGLFAQRLNELHEMLYRRGGIRPVNAAIEELSKLLLLEWVAVRDTALTLTSGSRLADALDTAALRTTGDVGPVKQAFAEVIVRPELAGRLPDGSTQPIWPADEPLRLARADVLAEALDVLRDALARVGETDYDLLGSAFDVFLRGRYDHGGGLATHLTPQTVVTTLARIALTDFDLLADPIDGPVFGDPCCGTGRFLVGGLLEIHQLAGPDRTERYRQLIRDGIFGADQSHSAVAKARLNLLLAGAAHPQVFAVSDSITEPSIDRLRGRLRLILTNPPFGSGKYDDPLGIELTKGELPAVKARGRIDPAHAFIARCVQLLGSGGRLGIILPDGLVDGRELKATLLREGSVRRRDLSVEANIALPSATFALSGTIARTSALLLRKGGQRRASVFLARAEHVGYLKQGGVRVDDPAGDDLPQIADIGRAALLRGDAHELRTMSDAPLAALVPRDDLQTLDPARLDPAATAARDELRVGGGPHFAELLQPVRRRKQPTIDHHPFVSVLHVDDLGAVRWHEALNYRPTTPGQLARRGELLVSLLNPSKLRATVVPDTYDEVLCSAEFGVFATTRDPWEVLCLIQDERVRAQLAPLGRGTSSSRRRIEPDDLLDTYAPAVDDEQLRRRGRALEQALEMIRRATLEIAELYSSGSSSNWSASTATIDNSSSSAAS